MKQSGGANDIQMYSRCLRDEGRRGRDAVGRKSFDEITWTTRLRKVRMKGRRGNRYLMKDARSLIGLVRHKFSHVYEYQYFLDRHLTGISAYISCTNFDDNYRSVSHILVIFPAH